VVNVHDYASLPYVALANVIGGRRPIVFTAHGLLYEGFESLRVRHRLAARCLSGLTAVTEAVGQRHREYLNWSTSISVLPNGVETLKRSEGARERLRKELGISPDCFVFLAVGNARPEKGFEDLLAAMKWLTRRDPARTCLCLVAGKVGDDDYGRLLRDQLHAHNLTEEVRFLGFRSDARELYSAADAFVLSSRSEGLPMVILEAMMAELPVVATKVGGVGDVVTTATGKLVASGNPQALGAAMQAMMNDPRRAGQLGQAGRRRAVDKYSVERMCDRYIEVFSTVIRR
jgi:glycosyltransferase involved in cell wall biosynthesis